MANAGGQSGRENGKIKTFRKAGLGTGSKCMRGRFSVSGCV